MHLLERLHVADKPRPIAGNLRVGACNNLELLEGPCGELPRTGGEEEVSVDVPLACRFVTFDSVPPRALAGAAEGLVIGTGRAGHQG